MIDRLIRLLFGRKQTVERYETRDPKVVTRIWGGGIETGGKP